MGRRLGDRGVATSTLFQRRLLWPALTTLVMLAITLGLGTWQIERLAWKTALLATIDHAETLPPRPIPATPEPFERVVVEGTFLPMTALYGAELRTDRNGPAMGGQLLTPLAPPTGPVIIVDRGWVPLDVPRDPPPGPQRIEGYIRPPERGSWASPANDLAQHRFFSLDPQAIGQAFGLPAVAPFTLVQLGNPSTSPQPATALPRPPNDHLSYAITWFSLAAALLLIFALFVRQSLRTEPAP